MNKMFTMSVAVMILSLLIVPGAQAEDGPVKKLARGVVNVVTAPIEIPKQARAYWVEGARETDHILVWIASGTVWGIIQTVKRAGSGVWDIVTFPVEKPADYAPLLEPDYVFEQWPRNPDSGR